MTVTQKHTYTQTLGMRKCTEPMDNQEWKIVAIIFKYRVEKMFVPNKISTKLDPLIKYEANLPTSWDCMFFLNVGIMNPHPQ